MKEWIYKNNLLSFKVIHLKYIYFKSFSFLLVFLMMFIGDISFAQNANTAKIEQIQLNNHPQAKTDIEALMKKHNLTTLDDLVDKDPEEIFKIRDELIILLWKNGESAYHLDTNVVKMRDALRMYMDWYADASFDRSIYKTVVWRWEKLKALDEKLAKTDEKLAKTDEKLAKTDEKLAKTDEKLAKEIAKWEELKKIAKMMGVSENNINK